jgi:dihydroflavonol-4-reductase
LLNGRFPTIFEGASSFVYIDDVGKAHVLAADKGQIGEAYIISERIITMSEWFSMICHLAGVKRPPVGPRFIGSFFANLGEFVSRFTKKRPLLPKDNVKLMAHGFRVDGSKAVRDLGIEYTPLEEGMRRAITWYWEQGLLKHEPALVREN